MKRSLPVVLTLGIVAIVALAVLWNEAQGPESKPDRETPMSRLSSKEEPAVASAPGSNLTPAADPEPSSRVSVEPVKLGNSAGAAAREVLFLNGAVSGPTADAVEPLTVQVSIVDGYADPRNVKQVPVSKESPQFEFRDSEKFLRALRDGQQLRVALWEGKRQVHVEAVGLADGQPRGAIERLLEFAIVRNLTFTAAPRVKGRVVDEEGRPVSEANVIVLMKDTLPTPRSIANITTPLTGEFDLAPTENGSAFLLLHKIDMLVKTKDLLLPAAGIVDVGDVVLPSGSEISGVLRGASPLYPIEGVDLIAFPDERGQGFVANQQSFQSTSTGISLSHPRTTTDLTGAFRFRGLSLGSFRVVVNGRENSGSMGGRPNRNLKVSAPSKGVDILWDDPLVKLYVHDGDTPLTNARATFQGEKHQTAANVDAKGIAYLIAPEKSKVHVSVEFAGFVREVREVTTGTLGEVVVLDIPLHRPTNPAKLILDIVDEADKPIRSIVCTLVPKVTSQVNGVWNRNSKFVNGRHEFLEIPPGAYDAEINGGNWSDPATFHVPARFEVVLAENETLTRRVKLDLGGRLQVRITDDHDKNLDATCMITDLHGNPVKVRFPVLDPVANVIWSDEQIPHPQGSPATATADVTPPLLPGVYEVKAELEGYESVKITVEVKSRERTPVRFKMRKL